MKISSHIVYGCPWALERDCLERLPTLEIAATAAPAAAAGPGRASNGFVAVLPLVGVIAARDNIVSRIMGWTTLDRFSAALGAVADDPSVKEIILDVDSPGGTVDGVTEAAHRVFAAREKKRITAIANTSAMSAAYWIASAANEFIASPSARVGSVGVYALHVDRSEQAAREGIKPTLISAGENKADVADTDGLTPISEEGLAILQSMVNQVYGMMVTDIAKFRGASQKTVRETYGGGRAFLSQEALKLGMVDRIAAFDHTLDRVSGRLSRQRAQARDKQFFSNATL